MTMPETKEGDAPIRCGDVVLHRPSGEEWIVAAADPESDALMWCGWPEGVAKLSDCELLRRASPEKSAELHAQLTGTRRAMADRVYGRVPVCAPAPQAHIGDL
jgi:hypothetical protein